MNKKKICAVSVLVLLAIFMILIGPLDCFTHGFFYDEIDCGQIAEDGWKTAYDLGEEAYEMQFSPQENHFAGFEIYLINQPDGNSGSLLLVVSDTSGRELDTIEIDLSKVRAATWYKVYTTAKLKARETYTLKFVANNCSTYPYLQAVDEDYLSPETITGDVLLAYAYAKSTFSFQDKVIICLFILAFGLFCGTFLVSAKRKICCKMASVVLLMVGILTWNYMYNSMDNMNDRFNGFQADSETLVTGVIYAEEDGVYFNNDDERGFGMGRYFDLKGSLESYGMNYISDENWYQGYSRSESAIVVNSNIYSKDVAIIGNYILFENGETYQITNIEDNGSNIVIYLNAGKVLSSAKNGSLDDAQFFDSNMQPLAKSRIEAYKSQYGLNGKIFRHMARYLEDDQEIAILNLFCCLLTALIFALIVLLIFEKYNITMAGCFFVVFWLSPWVVNFARNLYWVEFTWYIPMLIGLFCSWRIEKKKCRVISYAATFLSIFIKCLCGYEYISVVMMALIGFLLVDLIKYIFEKDRNKCRLLLRTIVIIGVIALGGFFAAICVHAPLKGDGSVIEGIKNIFEQDVLRRTAGGDLNDFHESLWPSFNASIWETYSKYFHFETEVITGITGNIFPLLCVVPLCIFLFDYAKKRLNVEEMAMYIIFFLTSISWFCLAKGHSYIHTHMNYVLWYFGFVQICIYIIVNRCVCAVNNKGDVQ